MSMKNSKTGKKAKEKTKIVTGILSGGSSGAESRTGIKRISGWRAGTKNIPALFWSVTLSTNGPKETEGKGGNE